MLSLSSSWANFVSFKWPAFAYACKQKNPANSFFIYAAKKEIYQPGCLKVKPQTLYEALVFVYKPDFVYSTASILSTSQCNTLLHVHNNVFTDVAV